MGSAGGAAWPTVGRVARDDAGQSAPQFRLLGPLRVTLDGRELDLGGPRQRALLALLALSAGSAVPPAQLIDCPISTVLYQPSVYHWIDEST